MHTLAPIINIPIIPNLFGLGLVVRHTHYVEIGDNCNYPIT